MPFQAGPFRQDEALNHGCKKYVVSAFRENVYLEKCVEMIDLIAIYAAVFDNIEGNPMTKVVAANGSNMKVVGTLDRHYHFNDNSVNTAQTELT